jgi:regulator of nonsense transcripts 2
LNVARIDDDDDDGEQDEVVVLREPKHDEVDLEEEADFDREFAKMLADTTDVRKVERKAAPPVFDTAVPLIRRKAGEVDGGAGIMQFSLLSRRGNKQHVSGTAAEEADG